MDALPPGCGGEPGRYRGGHAAGAGQPRRARGGRLRERKTGGIGSDAVCILNLVMFLRSRENRSFEGVHQLDSYRLASRRSAMLNPSQFNKNHIS